MIVRKDTARSRPGQIRRGGDGDGVAVAEDGEQFGVVGGGDELVRTESAQAVVDRGEGILVADDSARVELGGARVRDGLLHTRAGALPRLVDVGRPVAQSRAEYELKGVPGEWHLYSATTSS
jgi:hypothetical protein